MNGNSDGVGWNTIIGIKGTMIVEWNSTNSVQNKRNDPIHSHEMKFQWEQNKGSWKEPLDVEHLMKF